jgi:hypothetical protein
MVFPYEIGGIFNFLIADCIWWGLWGSRGFWNEDGEGKNIKLLMTEDGEEPHVSARPGKLAGQRRRERGLYIRMR